MLKWFIDNDKVEDILKRHSELVSEEEVEVRPENLPDAVLDENVDVCLIRRFFTDDAWLAVMDAVEVKKAKSVIYVCKICYHDLHQHPSIVCDHCLSWYHIHCAGLKREPKSKFWFCRKCHQSPFC